MDNLEAMRIFVSVATQGSFTEAARRMRLSPSAVTRSILQIEEKLGLLLFNRTTRSVQLTQRGQIYLEIANKSSKTSKWRRGASAARMRNPAAR